MPIPNAVTAIRAVLAPARPAPVAPPRAAEAPKRPAAPADALVLSEAAALAKGGEVRLAPGRDALTIAVQPGDTLWKLASRWGAQGATRAYVAAIREANGLAGDAIKAGQALRLPYDEESAGLNLLVALAIQKDLAARGKAAPALDLAAVAVNPGPLDSYLVTCPRRDGKGLQHFAIFDDQTGEDTYRWFVDPVSKQAYEARQRGEF